MPKDRASVLLVFADPVLYPFAQPYGLSIIRSLLSRSGIESTIALPFLAANPSRYLARLARENCVRLTGISFRNLDPAGFSHEEAPYSFLPSLISLVEAVRAACPDSTIAVGGSGFSIDPYAVLSSTLADVGFIGPSEQQFCEFAIRLLGASETNRNLCLSAITSDLPSAILADHLDHSQEAHVHLGLPRKRLPPVPIASPPTDLVLPEEALEFAKITGGTIPIRTKTGCSLRCSYCVVPFIERLALRSLEDVLRDFDAVVAMGLGDRIFIADGEFNLPDANRAIELCGELANRYDSSLRWRCYLCPSEVPAALPSALKLGGCCGVGVAVDSLSDPVRQKMGKRVSTSEAMASVERLVANGIETTVTILFGAPEESDLTVSETIANALELLKLGVGLSITVGLRVYPYTPLWRLAQKALYEPFVECEDSDERALVFCSPQRREALAARISRDLPESSRVYWTKPPRTVEDEFFGRLGRSVHYRLDGLQKEALVELEAMPEMWKDDPRTLLAKAKVLREAGRLEEAKETLKRCGGVHVSSF